MFLLNQPARKLKVIITTVRLATIKYIANSSWLKLRYYNFLKIEKLKDLKKNLFKFNRLFGPYIFTIVNVK